MFMHILQGCTLVSVYCVIERTGCGLNRFGEVPCVHATRWCMCIYINVLVYVGVGIRMCIYMFVYCSCMCVVVYAVVY